MSLTVKELRDALANLPDDMPVVMSKDAQGSGHSPLADAEEAMYLADSTWSGEVYLTPEQLADNLAGDNNTGWSDEDGAPDEAVRVLLLGPTN